MFGIGEAMLIAGALSAAGAVGGGMMANQEREDAANSANKWGLWMQQGQMQHQNEMANFNARQAAIAREWSAGMSNTAYRRAMADMRAAGLNPMLAYQQGGASAGQAVAGSGSASAGFTPGAKADVQEVIGPAVSSALQAATAVGNAHQVVASVDQTRANTDLLQQETQLRKEQQAMTQAATAESIARTVTEGHRAGLVKGQTATEMMNPALRAAQTAQASATAGQASENTVGLRQENERFRNWGPRSSAADAGANIEAAGRRAAASGATPQFREALDGVLRGLGGQGGYSGPRSLPTPPPSGRSRWVDDPYGLSR